MSRPEQPAMPPTGRSAHSKRSAKGADAKPSFTNPLLRLVLVAPAVVLLLAIALTGVFGYISGQGEMASGNDAFAPDYPEIEAFDTISDRFDSANESVMQVLVEGDDVVSGPGAEAAAAIETAIRDAVGEATLADTDERPAVVSWLTPLQPALAQAGADLTTMDDEQVAAAVTDARTAVGDEPAAFADRLLPSDASATDASAGLMIVFIQTDEVAPDHLDDQARWDALGDNDRALAEAIRAADLPAGFDADAFSMSLMFDEDMEAFDAELTRLFGGAFLIILAILGFVYWVKPAAGLTRIAGTRRTVADVLMTMLTIVMAIVWMQGISVLLGPGFLDWIGPANDISQVVPVLMIGLGVDYAIHLVSRYREEAAAGGNVRESVKRAIQTVGVALTLATVTTAVGFLTNVVNPVPALATFGVVAAVGIVCAFVLMLTVVPSIRLLLDRRAERVGRMPTEALARGDERLLPGVMSRVAWLAQKAPVPTVLVTVVLGGALGAWGLTQLEVRFSQTDFVSDDSAAVSVYEDITDRFDGGFGESTEVLVTGQVATADTHNALVGAVEALADVTDVSTLGDQAQVDSVVGLLAVAANPDAASGADPGGADPDAAEADPAAAGTDPDAADADPDAADVTGGVDPQAYAAFTEAADEVRLADDLTVDSRTTDADVAALYDALYGLAPQDADRLLARGADGSYEAMRLTVETTAGEEGASALRTNLDDAFAPVATAGIDVVATSDEIANDVVVDALSDSQVTSLAVTLLAAMLLLAVTFWFRNRRPALGVITVAPVALVVLWTFAMMAATGIPFGPITATIAALAIGIGVPYTIHITNRYQEDRMVHANPADAIRSTVRHTGGALAGSAFTTCAGFGILVTASMAPFRQLGLVTVYAIGFALLASTLVLPSLLVLWDRWHRRRSPVADATEAEANAEVGSAVVEPM